MGTQIVTAPPGVFNFLDLPSELRNRIYQLHLSKAGIVDCPYDEKETDVHYHSKPLIGVNILRACKQIYNEAVTFAYADCKWLLGPASFGAGHLISDRFSLDCAARLTRIPHGTIDKVQHLGLNILFEENGLIRSVMSVEFGDLTKLKSLRTLEVFLFPGEPYSLIPEWHRRRGITYRHSSLLMGLVCHILSQTPTSVEVKWTSVMASSWQWREDIQLNSDMAHLTHKFRAVKGCNCTTST